MKRTSLPEHYEHPNRVDCISNTREIPKENFAFCCLTNELVETNPITRETYVHYLNEVCKLEKEFN